MQNEFTKEDDEHLAVYIAINSPEQGGRREDDLYKKLVQNQECWPWSTRHRWRSWMKRYNAHHDSFDLRIRAYLNDHQVTDSPPPPPPNPKPRAAFTPEKDQRLMTSLYQSSPGYRGAAGIYPDILVANPDNHLLNETYSWRSGQSRSRKRSVTNDENIARWQKRHEITPKALTDAEWRPDMSWLLASNDSHDKVKRIITKRRFEEEDEEEVEVEETVDAKVITDPDSPSHPKRQKLSPSHTLPIPGKQEIKQSSAIARESGSMSHVVGVDENPRQDDEREMYLPASIPALSTDSGSPTITARVGDMTSPAPTGSLVCVDEASIPRLISRPSTPTLMPDQDVQIGRQSTRPSLFMSISSTPGPFVYPPSLPRRTTATKGLLENTASKSLGEATRRQIPRKEDVEDDGTSSDGPFATSSPSPRSMEVIRGFPKHHQGPSFRNTVWVRERKVISRKRKQNSSRPDAIDHEGDAREDARTHKTVPAKMKTSSSAGDHHEDNSSRGVMESRIPERKTEDMLENRRRAASDSNHDPFALETPHLPKYGAPSSKVRVHHDSYTPRHKASHQKARRPTFAGFGSRSSLPNINLFEKLGKRTSRWSSALLRTKRTSSDVGSSSESVASISRTHFDALQYNLRRHRPARTVVMPLVNPGARDLTPVLLSEWSPSTRNIVIQAGLATVLKRMEDNHGFSADVVRRAWLQQNMDLDATDRMLLRMRIAAENASFGNVHVEKVKHNGRSISRALQGTQNESRVLSIKYPTRDSDAFETDYTPPRRSRAEQYRLAEQSLSKGIGRYEHELVNSRDSDAFETDYTPPRRSRAEQYRLAEQSFSKGIGRYEHELVNNRSSTSPAGKDKDISSNQAVWRAEEDVILREGNEDRLETLANKFSEDIVRRRFLEIMRKGHFTP